MAFEVETGTGSATANAYTTVAFVDEYIGIRTTSTAWDDLSDAAKENYIMWASKALDQYATYDGTKYAEDSAMRWPRSGTYDRDGFSISYDTIPLQLREVIAEITMYLVANGIDISTGATEAPGAGELKRIKADVIELEFKDYASVSPSNSSPFPPNINRLLMPLGRVNTGNGSRFVPIQRV